MAVGARAAGKAGAELVHEGHVSPVAVVDPGDHAEPGGEVAAAFRQPVGCADLREAALHGVDEAVVDVGGATEVPAGKVGRPTTQPSRSNTLMRLALPSLCGIVGSRL